MKIHTHKVKEDASDKEKDKTFDERWDKKFGVPRTEVLSTTAALKLLHEMVTFS